MIKIPESFLKHLKLLESKQHVFESLLPRRFDNNQDMGIYLSKSDISPMLKLDDVEAANSVAYGILNICWDMIDRGGKKWRPVYGLMLNKLIGNKLVVTEDTLYKILQLVEIIHNASLVLDDIMDDSKMRRNKPCSYLLYGTDISLNGGNTLYFMPFYHVINGLKDDLENNTNANAILKNVVKAYLQELTALHIGQNMDTEMRHNRIPEVETYNDIVLCKTGVALRLISKWIMSISDMKGLEVNDKYGKMSFYDYIIKISDHLSISFQIKDDLLNVIPSSVSDQKGIIGEDIFEGKQSLMVLHGLRMGKDQKKVDRLNKIVHMKTTDQSLIKEAIGIMHDLGSIQYAQEHMKEHYQICHGLLDNLVDYAPNKEAVQDIKDLVSYLIERS